MVGFGSSDAALKPTISRPLKPDAGAPTPSPSLSRQLAPLSVECLVPPHYHQV